MLVQTISQYLGSHKRLVVPQLGTFIVKEPGVSIVFSELLKRDDGVLRGLLREAGVGELEAAGEIDRFVFEVRMPPSTGRSSGSTASGCCVPAPTGRSPSPTSRGLCSPLRTQRRVPPRFRPGRGPAPAGQTPPKLPYSEPRVSPSAKMNPDPSVRGLRYGKPPKTTAAYTYVDRPPRRRRADRFIWVAAIAAAIAVAAIAFGYLREANDKEAEMQYLEQPADPQPATDTGAATPEQPITE